MALDSGHLDVIVNMSQMTVSQMTLTSTGESKQHRLHWLAEHVLNWSGLPVIHVRPTVFLDNPLFTVLAKQAVRERGVLVLPFGTAAHRRSPLTMSPALWPPCCVVPPGASDEVFELTGPEVLDINGIAEHMPER